MRKESWIGNALLGLLLTLLVLGAFVTGIGLESLELKTYDWRAYFRGKILPSNDIVIVAIDDDSIARFGRWPWPRTRIASVLRKLKEAKPRVIGLDILFSEPTHNPGLGELDALRKKYRAHVGAGRIAQSGVAFDGEFAAAARRLDTDSHLAAAIRETPGVVLPMYFGGFEDAAGRPPELPPELEGSALGVRVTKPRPDDPEPVEASKAVHPLVELLKGSAGAGFVNVFTDVDGVVRRETPAVKYGDRYYPSYALQLVTRYLNLKPGEVQVHPGQAIHIGAGRKKREIPLDESQSMLVTFSGGERAFTYQPFHAVYDGKISKDVFKDKIVIIGLTAEGVGGATRYVTPVSPALPSVEFVANTVRNILKGDHVTRPEWAMQAELGAIAVIGLFIMFVLPRRRALTGAALTVLLLCALFGSGAYLFMERGEWVKVSYPAVLLFASYVVIVTKRFFSTERGKEMVEFKEIENNKMLGLSFQGQGMLDMAFEKFRLCPLDDSLMETLYNLGLDFERKRQYAKAVSVYKHMAEHDEGYKDIAEKVKTLQAAAEGAVFGGVGGKSAEGTVLVTDGASKPQLGRYEIVKELGRGAMGIVYLGKDPKINRQVAIKTLMLEDGSSSPAETKEIKERFFREAESAGTLNHPGIVRIFDAGEDQDVCYIAMELLDGDDLVEFTRKESLLPMETALRYCANVAEALDYAHGQGIVHRDIKPANIMLLKDGAVRVTDFGIARITASSKTATGTVMGTPSYMSPEQVAGKKVDGRADIFSLGVALYEFLTGEKPFKGGEGIGTLLFQIANDPHPDPRTVNPDILPSVKAVIDKALTKDPEKRYQKAGRMAAELKACLDEVKGGAKAPPAAEKPAEAPPAEKPPEEKPSETPSASAQAAAVAWPGASKGPTSPAEPPAAEASPAKGPAAAAPAVAWPGVTPAQEAPAEAVPAEAAPVEEAQVVAAPAEPEITLPQPGPGGPAEEPAAGEALAAAVPGEPQITLPEPAAAAAEEAPAAQEAPAEAESAEPQIALPQAEPGPALELEGGPLPAETPPAEASAQPASPEPAAVEPALELEDDSVSAEIPPAEAPAAEAAAVEEPAPEAAAVEETEPDAVGAEVPSPEEAAGAEPSPEAAPAQDAMTAEEVASSLALLGGDLAVSEPEPPAESAPEPGPAQDSAFTVGEIAESLAGSADEPAQESAQPEAAPAPAPAEGAGGALELADSIMPQVAPGSVKPEEVTSPNLGEELKKAQERMQESPAPVEPPSGEKTDNSIHLVDPG